MKVGIIGCGAIGGALAKAADKMNQVEQLFLFDIDEPKLTVLYQQLEKCTISKSVEDLISSSDLVVEAANIEFIKANGSKVLEAGKDLMVLSGGAFVDEEFLTKMKCLASKTGGRIFVPSGAIGGVDAVGAASVGKIDKITLTTHKPPEALADSPGFSGRYSVPLAEEAIVFMGTASKAVENFPKNINVSSVLSRAGIGPEKTRVKIVAVPGIERNTHEVHVEGEFGSFYAKVESIPSKDNIKTSQLAVFSAIATLRKIVSGVFFGL